MQRLKAVYVHEVVPKLMSEFNYKNLHQVPKLQKIIINRGFGEAHQNSKVLDSSMDELASIAAQRGVVTVAKKAIASFKVRQGLPVGMSVTLRGERMYSFLDRLINLSLPRIRDFSGLDSKSFDGFGNYCLGLNEQLMFAEVSFDNVQQVQGMDIVIVTSCNTDNEGRVLLKLLGLPLKRS